MPKELLNPQEAAFYRVVGANVRRAREFGCLMQHQVADKVDICRYQISRLESGKRCLTTEESLRMLKVLGVSVDYLLEGTSELAEEHRRAKRMLKALPQPRLRCPECGRTFRPTSKEVQRPSDEAVCPSDEAVRDAA